MTEIFSLSRFERFYVSAQLRTSETGWNGKNPLSQDGLRECDRDIVAIFAFARIATASDTYKSIALR